MITLDEFIAGIQARAQELRERRLLRRPSTDPVTGEVRRGRGRPPKPILDVDPGGDVDLIAAAFDPIEEPEENDTESY